MCILIIIQTQNVEKYAENPFFNMFNGFIIVIGNDRHNVNVNGNVNRKQVLLKQYIILYTFFGITAKSWELYCISNGIIVLVLLLTQGFRPFEQGFYQNYISRLF